MPLGMWFCTTMPLVGPLTSLTVSLARAASLVSTNPSGRELEVKVRVWLPDRKLVRQSTGRSLPRPSCTLCTVDVICAMDNLRLWDPPCWLCRTLSREWSLMMVHSSRRCPWQGVGPQVSSLKNCWFPNLGTNASQSWNLGFLVLQTNGSQTLEPMLPNLGTTTRVPSLYCSLLDLGGRLQSPRSSGKTWAAADKVLEIVARPGMSPSQGAQDVAISRKPTSGCRRKTWEAVGPVQDKAQGLGARSAG